MVEGININEIQGKINKGIVNELKELSVLKCTEGLYERFLNNGEKYYIYIYENTNIDDLTRNKYLYLTEEITRKSNCHIETLSISELKFSMPFCPLETYFLKKDLKKAQCIYANENVKQLVKSIRS